MGGRRRVGGVWGGGRWLCEGGCGKGGGLQISDQNILQKSIKVREMYDLMPKCKKN